MALEWSYAQSFGDKQSPDEVAEADIISTVEFDRTGDFLATGDKGGRIVIFERSNDDDGGASSGSARVRNAC